MRVFAVFAIFTLMLTGPEMSRAAESPRIRGGGGDLPGALQMSAEDCQRLLARRGGAVAHRPDAGVSYQPGQDVHGRPVAPAELPGSNPLPLDGLLTLDVTIPLSTLMGSRAPARVGDSELSVSRVTIDPATGRLAFDGRPVDGSAETAIAAACVEQLKQPAKPR